MLWLGLMVLPGLTGLPEGTHDHAALGRRDESGQHGRRRTAIFKICGRCEQRVGLAVHLQNHQHAHTNLLRRHPTANNVSAIVGPQQAAWQAPRTEYVSIMLALTTHSSGVRLDEV